MESSSPYFNIVSELGVLPEGVVASYNQAFEEKRLLNSFYCEEVIRVEENSFKAIRIHQARKQVAAAAGPSLWEDGLEFVAYEFEEQDDESFITNQTRLVIGILVAYTDLNRAKVGESVHLSAFDSDSDIVEIVEPNDTFRRFQRTQRGKRPGAWVRIT